MEVSCCSLIAWLMSFFCYFIVGIPLDLAIKCGLFLFLIGVLEALVAKKSQGLSFFAFFNTYLVVYCKKNRESWR